MAMTIYTSSDEKWCFAEQTTWGTAVADSGNAHGILTEGFGVNSTINFRNPPRARAQRYNHTSDMQADQKGVVYQTEGCNTPGVKGQLDFLLYGVMQNVTESSGSPYQKDFTFGQTQPDFSNNAGEFFTLWGVQQVASTSQKMYDAIISELTLSCAEDSNEGVLWAQPVWMGRYHEDDADQSGTITYPTLSSSTQYYHYDIGTCTLGGLDAVLGANGFTLTIRNNARKVGQDSGVFENFALPRYDVELSIQILWDATSRNLISIAKAGTVFNTIIEWGSSGTDGHLKFALRGKLNNAVNLEHAIEGNFVPLNIVAGGDYGSDEPLEITMSNDTDRGW